MVKIWAEQQWIYPLCRSCLFIFVHFSRSRLCTAEFPKTGKTRQEKRARPRQQLEADTVSPTTILASGLREAGVFADEQIVSIERGNAL